jgi:O-glycosyl hydrolase
MSNKTLTIKVFGKEEKIVPKVFLYKAKDFMGKEMPMLGIQLYTSTDCGALMPYATLTKCFGEFFFLKDCAYIDTNNCPFADQFIEMGLAEDVGLTKESGMCSYPLWSFNEEFLREIGGAEYKQYCKAHMQYSY